MITLKELQYVDSWAGKIPMPGEEYSKDVMNQLKECYELYNKIYKNKEFNIIFSNGEEINFNILEANLCHMLGIDYQNIKGDFFNGARERIFNTSADFTSYNLLEMILENSDKVVENDNDKNIRAKFINYYKSQIKCEIFKKLSEFNKFNFGAINEENQKYLFVDSNETVCPYFLTGIKKDAYSDKYFVFSLYAPTNPKVFFENKEVSIPTQMIISDQDNLQKLKATADEKRQLITLYKNIIYKYNLINKINILGDYENILNLQSNEEKNLARVRE